MPSWAKWGLSLAGRSRPCLGGLARLGGPGDAARAGLFRAGDRHHAAERIGGGPCRRVRRRRQPDGLRTARRGDVSLSRDHLVRDCFHDDFAGPFREARSLGRSQHGLDSRADPTVRARASQAVANAAREAGCSCGARANTRAGSGSKEIGASVTICLPSELRSWRNWQTHQLEGLAVAIPWWFESTRPHQIFRERRPCKLSYFSRRMLIDRGSTP